MRLTVLAHAETRRTREGVFGDTSGLAPGARVGSWPARRAACVSGPEPACGQTASLLGLGAAPVLADLAGPDVGRWAGRPLAEVLDEDPDGVTAWLRDPDAVPHGGESLTALVRRVGKALDAVSWPPGGAVAVVTPLVVRAALAHALGASGTAVLRADVPPLGAVTMSRHGGTWRLAALVAPS
ncbi:MAG TPA: histidine phosphatase family protein [Intrasporangium sp.]|uniref:histidine phosphatase family protein n=1 Tax=Intrasporangium sp. TaxID=1925024 RepID=UPI002D78F4A1|nr:histidine phosphatase family protein [Intrasporangium sp.]HET7397365.1 histidine phosphatase family protein [Intrasporangium sp.]